MRIILILINILLLHHGQAERTKDKMYEKIKGSVGCFRRLNATHQIGCSSKRGGTTGVIHFCEDQSDLDFILKNGSADAYIPVIPTRLFTRNNVDKMSDSPKLSGLALFRDNKTSFFTHDRKCPNELFSLKDTCQIESKTLWNPHGTGLLYQNIPFPVFYVEDDVYINKIKDCFDKFNNYSYPSQGERALCSLQMHFFMYATKDTPTCLRRSQIKTSLSPVKTCDPLGDNNIWAPLFPLDEDKSSNKDVKYIVIAARLDTTSMFDKTVGANSPVTGIVALLATAQFLKNILPKNENYDKNVLFMFFNGETYDYMGSQRMLYDMMNGNFPVKDAKNSKVFPYITPNNISLFIELSQLSNNQENIYAHIYKSNREILKFIDKLENKNMSIKTVENSLPPSSLHTFIANQSELLGVLLTDHENEYVNQYYNSIYDNAENIKFEYVNNTENKTFDRNGIQKFIYDVSEMVGRAVYEEITQTSYGGSDSVDMVLIDELFHCYLENPDCRVNQAVRKRVSRSEPSSLYVGVAVIINFATSFTTYTLGWLTGDKVGPSNGSCTNDPKHTEFKYYNMSESLYDLNTTACYKIRVDTGSSVSPAFIIEDYDWSSGKYSSWTESTWDYMDMQMFLKPSAAHENMTIAIGSISIIFSFIIVYFVKSRSQILFRGPSPTEAPIDC